MAIVKRPSTNALWADLHMNNGRRYRVSLGTCDMQTAQAKHDKLVRTLEAFGKGVSNESAKKT